MVCLTLSDRCFLESGLGLMVFSQGSLVLVRRPVAKAGMRPDGVVVTPCFDDDPSFSSGAKPFHRQAFIAQLAVEALFRAVLQGLARVNVRAIDSGIGDPLQDSVSHKFGAIVRANDVRGSVLADEPAQHLDDTRRPNGTGHIDGEAFPRVLVDYRQAFELLAVGAGIKGEAVGPDLISHGRRQRPRSACGDAFAWSFSRHLEPRFTPQPITTINAHGRPLTGQKDPDTPVAIARILCGQATHRSHYRRITFVQNRHVTEHRSRNTE